MGDENVNESAVRQQSVQTVHTFLDRLEARNIPGFLALWAEEGVQEMPYSPAGFPARLEGKAAIQRQYGGLPDAFRSMAFRDRVVYGAQEDPYTVIAEFRGEIDVIATGKPYNNRYVGIFRLRPSDGKIVFYREYFDPIVLREAFGVQLQSNFNVPGEVSEFQPGRNRVTFTSEGVPLVGDLFLPTSYQPGERLPAVVVGGSWLTVKEQMAGLYARRLAEQGFAALAFDFRNFGESSGEPREFESPRLKIQDFRNAATYLASLPITAPGQIGGLGICASAGYLAHAIADGAPLRAFATVAAWLHDPQTVGLMYGGEEGITQRLERGDAARRKWEGSGAVESVLAQSATDAEAAMAFPLDYYENPARGNVPAWNNRFAVMSWREWLTFDALAPAAQITTPTLMVHSDDAALPDNVRRFYAALAGPHDLYWTQGSQIDFYDQEPFVACAVAVAASHFRTYL